jgi:hypothetical protein
VKKKEGEGEERWKEEEEKVSKFQVRRGTGGLHLKHRAVYRRYLLNASSLSP